jgi:TPR repeat protein
MPIPTQFKLQSQPSQTYGERAGTSSGLNSLNLLKLAGDQGFAEAQYNYGICLQNGDGVPIDLRGAAHYF